MDCSSRVYVCGGSGFLSLSSLQGCAITSEQSCSFELGEFKLCDIWALCCGSAWPGEVTAPSYSPCLQDHFSQTRYGVAWAPLPWKFLSSISPTPLSCALSSAFRLCVDVTQTKNWPQPDATGAQDPQPVLTPILPPSGIPL